jgi:ferredoxin-thioredoxin reductase catalytic subunit
MKNLILNKIFVVKITMTETLRRIERFWDGTIEFRWDMYGFVGMIVNGRASDHLNSWTGTKEIPRAIVGDYLFTYDNSLVKVWRRGQDAPTVYMIGFGLLHFNDEICYFIVGPVDNHCLSVISTKLFLEWILTLKPISSVIYYVGRHRLVGDHERDELEKRSQKLGLLSTSDEEWSLCKMDNVGHISGYTVNEDNEYTMDVTIEGNAEVENNYHTAYMCPWGKYIVTTGYNEDKLSSDGTVICICEYVKDIRITDGSILPIEETILTLRPIMKPIPDTDIGKLMKWIDSETLLLYDLEAVLINVKTKDIIDITEHAEDFLVDTSASKEIFILTDGRILTIETVRKSVNWIKYHRISKVMSETNTILFDRIYSFNS